jgi:hypothetical protein
MPLHHMSLPVRSALARLVPLVLAALLAGCGNGDGAAETAGPPPPPPLQVSSGFFDVTADTIFNGCDLATIYDGTYEIQIDNLGFTMGDEWSGSWDPKAATGAGESAHDVSIIRFCTVTIWTSVRVTFQSEDEFTGVITFRQRVDGDCRTACVSTWSIAGVRQPTAP